LTSGGGEGAIRTPSHMPTGTERCRWVPLAEELARGRGELKDAGDRHQQFVEGSAQATNELREEAERERQSASLMSQRLLKEQKTNAGAKDHLRDLNDQILVELKLRMQLQEGEERTLPRCSSLNGASGYLHACELLYDNPRLCDIRCGKG
jgi:hypothetical protein